MKIEAISQWDFDRPETLTGYPNDMPLVGAEFVKRVQRGLLGEYKDRLADLKRWESPSEEDLHGLSFEALLTRVANHCKTRNKSLFFGHANVFDWNFDQKQKRILYGLLVSILRDIPWRIDWNRVFDRTRNKA